MDFNDKLDPDKIKKNLPCKTVGTEIVVFASTSSTNDIAWEYASNKNNNGLVIFAEEQSAGRGRNGKKWLDAPGQSLLFSVLLTDSKFDAETLSLTCAVAIAEAIDKVGKHQAKIKWPNDIILNGQKLAGILIESRKIRNKNSFVIGVGINCHQHKDRIDKQIMDIATSLDIESGNICDRISVAKRILVSLEYWLGKIEKNKKIITQQWCSRSIQLNHRITLSYNGKNFTGNCIGIDPQKGLIVQLETGGVRMFDAVHCSIIK
ncbi:MAG TPA: biotin--[acetyl-CoA-carboxylase] ligase [Sedimentisphaerales bacterium]|nr:biotin--[acetyl-CoA-carboxylase] ligase [Sedimentisphaerales bacterium]